MDADNPNNEQAPTAQLAEAQLNAVQNTSLIERRRDQICDAALELFLEKGFASTTIRDICARSGVNQASIYDYIANKNDILRRLLNKLWFQSGTPQLGELLEQHANEPVKDLMARYLRESWTLKRKGTLLAYRTVPHLQSDDRRAMRARDQSVIDHTARQLRDYAGLTEEDPRAEIMANLIMFMAAFGPMRDWLLNDIDDEIIVETVATGMAAMIEHLAQAPTETASRPKTETDA